MTKEKRRSHRELRKPKQPKPATTPPPQALAVRPVTPAAPPATKKRK
jgi:hypothetical protein